VTDECNDQPPILKAAVDLPEEPLEPTIHGNQATDDGLIDRTEPEDSIATDEPSVEPAEDLPEDDKEAMDTDSKPEEADRAMPAFLVRLYTDIISLKPYSCFSLRKSRSRI